MNREGEINRTAAAAMLGVSYTTMKRWMREDKLRPTSIVVSNGKVRGYYFSLEQILALREEITQT